jgi:pSer/pThr/pTyr-binding forkhead associated (FHA) protein
MANEEPAPRQGDRAEVPSGAAWASPRLVTIAKEGPREYVLESGSLTLGRSESNQIVVSDLRVSRLHARIDHGPSGIELTDLQSANGTFVNGERVAHAVLRGGENIVVGSTSFRFERGGSRPTQQMATISTSRELETVVLSDPLAMLVNDTKTPCLVVTHGGRVRQFELADEALRIGREADNDIVLESPDVSRHHARVERRADGFWLVDLGSWNGTYVTGRRIEEEHLENGETIQVGGARLTFKGGFGVDDLEAEPEQPSGRRPVVVVPGLLGSELWRGSERLWPSLGTFIARPDALRLPDRSPVEARGLVREVVVVPNLLKLDQYSRLCDFLVEGLGYRAGVDLLEFGYDWRLDCRASAAELGAAIAAWREREPLARKPLTIIAHSLGCLVSRYFVERLGGKEVVDRLVLLGGPHGGVPRAVTTLVNGVNLLPFGLLDGRIRDVLQTFPTVYQILPVYHCLADDSGASFTIFDDESWVADWQRDLVRDARAFRRELGAATSVSTICIFGYDLETMTGFRVRRTPEGWGRLHLSVDLDGDDTIPVTSASMDGVDIHPVHQHHGSLYTDNDVKMRLKLELTGQRRPAPAR